MPKSRRTVTHAHDPGRSRCMPTNLGALSYRPNRRFDRINYACVLTDIQQHGPQRMLRPALICNMIIFAKLGGGIPPDQEAITQNALGPYQYDGAGNITEIGCWAGWWPFRSTRLARGSV